MLSLIALLAVAQVPPVDEMVMSVDLTNDISEALQASVPAIGGYCSLSGCRITGTVTVAASAGGLNVGSASNSSVAIQLGNPANHSGIQNTGASVGFVVSGSLVWLVNSGSNAWQGPGPMTVTGVARASLPTCNSGEKDALHWDQTSGEYVQCTDWGSGTYAWGQTSLVSISGYNALTSAALQTVGENRFYPIVRPVRLGFVVTAAGTGAGTFATKVNDATGSTLLCTGGSIACTSVAGTYLGSDCLATGSATSAIGHDVQIQLDCTGCTTCPTGNMTAFFY